jgi:hypothetical protein
MNKTKKSHRSMADVFRGEELFETMQECKLRLDTPHSKEQHQIMLAEYADAVAAFDKFNRTHK